MALDQLFGSFNKAVGSLKQFVGLFRSDQEKPRPPAAETRSPVASQTEAKNSVNIVITCSLYSLGRSFKDAFLVVIVGGRKSGRLELSDREPTAEIAVTLEPGTYQYQLSGSATTAQEEKVPLNGKGTIDVQEGVDFFVEKKEERGIQRTDHNYSLTPGRRIPGQEKSFTGK